MPTVLHAHLCHPGTAAGAIHDSSTTGVGLWPSSGACPSPQGRAPIWTCPQPWVAQCPSAHEPALGLPTFCSSSVQPGSDSITPRLLPCQPGHHCRKQLWKAREMHSEQPMPAPEKLQSLAGDSLHLV